MAKNIIQSFYISMLISSYKNNHTFQGKRVKIKNCQLLLGSSLQMQSENFTQISPVKKFLIRKFSPERLKELAMVNCDVAEKVKNYLDNLYGRDNYTLIAVGRSLATVAETVKLLGGDAKIIPLSQMRHSLPKEIKDTDVYKKYLDHVGLSRKDLTNNAKRKYILMDFAVSGMSLENTEQMLKNENFLGNLQNLTRIELNTIPGISKTKDLFYFERFKHFSPVGKLPIEKFGDTFIQAKPETCRELSGNVSSFLRKLFCFNVIDAFSKGSYKDFYPQKELHAVERLKTQTALKNSFKKAIKHLELIVNSATRNNEIKPGGNGI